MKDRPKGIFFKEKFRECGPWCFLRAKAATAFSAS